VNNSYKKTTTDIKYLLTLSVIITRLLIWNRR